MLAVGEVSGSTFVCNGATGSSGNDGADGDRYVGRILYTSGGTRLGEIVHDLEYLSATSTPPLSSTWVTPDRLLIVKDDVNNRHVGYVASSKTNLAAGNGYTQVMFRTRKLEDAALVKLTTFSTSVVYTNADCNSSGAYFAYRMLESYIRTGSCNGACTRFFDNKPLQDYLSGLGLNVVYNYNSTQDISVNCAAPVLSTAVNANGSPGACETLWYNNDLSTTQTARGYICPVSFVTNVFPDSIAAGWYVQRN